MSKLFDLLFKGFVVLCCIVWGCRVFMGNEAIKDDTEKEMRDAYAHIRELSPQDSINLDNSLLNKYRNIRR